MEIIFKPMSEKDWPQVAAIYKEGIETGHATFQLEIPSWNDWNKGHLKLGRIVAISSNKVIGWAALTPVSGRCVYAGVAEVSVYVSTKNQGEKLGTKLLKKLIEKSEELQIWTLQSGIFPENIPSLKIHETLGFRTVGYREKIEKMKGVWRDTILLERRSTKIGID